MTKDGGFLLPEVIDPPRKCLTIMLPDDQNHLAAFWGALQVLAYWFSWQRDPDHKGVQVSSVWTAVIQEAHTKFYSEDPCEVDMSCDDVADCIETSEVTQAAIRNFILNDTIINQHIQTTARGGVALPEVELPIIQGCDPDPAWGAVVAIIDQMDVNNVDFFELFELESNRIEQASTLIGAIPKFQELPIDEFLMFVNQLFENIAENYAAAITTELKNEYKCDLFCIGINDPDCILRFDAMYNYFKDRIGGTFTIESLFPVVIEFLAEGTFSGSLVADFMMMMQVEVLRSTNNFLGLDVLSLNTVASLGALNPSSGWELLCDCGPTTWCFTIDFTATDGSEYGVVLEVSAPGVPLFVSAVHDAGVGLVFVPSGDHDRTYFTQQLPNPLYLTSATLEWDYQTPLTGGNVYIGQDFGSPTTVSSPQTSLTKEFDPEVGLTNLVVGGDKPGADVTPFIILKRITYTGDGDIPSIFGASNC